MRKVILALAVMFLLMASSSLMGGFRDVGEVEDPHEAPIDVQDRIPPSQEFALEGNFFIENEGQVDDPRVLFYAHGGDLSVGLTREGVLFTMRERPEGSERKECLSAPEPVEATWFGLHFEGANAAEPMGVDRLDQRLNYLIGNEPSGWRRGIRSWSEVHYHDIYDGVDLRFYFKDGMFKYDFILDADVNPDVIDLRYDGVEGVELDPSTGDLLVSTGLGTIRDSRPVMYQDAPTGRVDVSGDFALRGDGSLGFRVPGECSRSAPMVIDPGIQFSTFLGGSGDDWDFRMDVDDAGNIYIVAMVSSWDFPTTEGVHNEKGYIGRYGYQDGVVAKLDPTGSELLFATFIGGKTDDMARDVAVKPNGNMVIVGGTTSRGFPVTSDALFVDPPGSMSGYLLELSADGSQLLYSTFLGGERGDAADSLYLDDAGNMYVAGYTSSFGFPHTEGAYCTTLASPSIGMIADIFVTKMTSSYALDYSTYIGGCWEDHVYEICLDASGSLFLVGNTRSDPFIASPGGYSSDYHGGEGDGYILSLSPDGSKVEHWTYLGGAAEDRITSISIGKDGSIYLVGVTESRDLPVTFDAMQSRLQGDWDAFICEFDSDLEDLRFCTYFGGDQYDWTSFGLVVDEDEGVLHFGGATSSSDLPTTSGCYDATYAGGFPWFKHDAFLTSMNISDHKLRYSTYLGGTEHDSIYDIHIYDDGSLLLLLYSNSGDFPITPGAYQSTIKGNNPDFLVVRFDPSPCGPDPPANIKADTGDGYVTLGWDVRSEFRYRVQKYILYKGDSAANMAPIQELDATDGRFTDRDVTNGNWYHYGVSTVSSGGESDLSMVKARPLALPTAPLEPLAESGDGTVNVSWNAPLDTGGELLGYRVFRGRTLDVLNEIVPNCTGTFHVDEEVETGRSYYYTVVAFNTRGTGPMSEHVRIKAVSPPSPPSSLWVIPGDRCVQVRWGPLADNGGSDLEGYRVYRGSSPLDMVFWYEYGPNTYSHRDTGCVNGVPYFYHVTSFTNVDESIPSPTRSAVPFGPPSKPRIIVAEAGDGQVSLSWTEPKDDNGRPITGYRVYCGESPGSLDFSATIGNGTRFLHAGATNGITYYYQVAAINKAGEGRLRSETVSATPMGLPGRPTALATESILGSIKLSWRSPADMGGSENLFFRVFRGDSLDSLELLAELSDCEEYIDDAVWAGRIYYYSVRAVNVVGEGQPSLTVTGVLFTEPGPILAPVVSTGDGYVQLVWDPPETDGGSAIRGYIVYKGTQDTSLRKFASSLTFPFFNDTEVENGRTYLYRIQAENAVGPSLPSAMVSGTPIGIPGPVEMLWAVVEGDSVRLTWSGPSVEGCAPICGYIVMRGRIPGELTPYAYVNGSLAYIDPGLERGSTLYYSVVTNSTLGAGPASEIVEANIVPLETQTRTPIGYWIAPILLVLVIVGAYAWRRRSMQEDLPSEAEALDDVALEVDTISDPFDTYMSARGEEATGYIVEKVFVVYKDGRMVVEAARQEYSTTDADLMSGLLIAIQSIVQYGFEKGSSLESIKYGENLILLTSGDHINLATVIYGRPTRALTVQLETTVGQIEDHFSDILDTWSGDQAEFLGAMGLIAPLVESTEHLTKEDVMASTTISDVSLLSAVDFHRGYVRLRVVALNTTDEQIVDAAIEIRYDPDMLRVERVEPARFSLRGDRVMIDRIEPGKSTTVAILLDPQICQGTHIDGTFTYYDVSGEYHRLDMKRCHADVVCPIFFTQKNANTAMLRRLIRERLKVTEFRLFRYPRTVAPSEMLNIGKSAIGGIDVQQVREYVNGGPPYEAEVWYYGETRVKGHQVVMRLGVIEAKNALEFFAASTSTDHITGLLAEFRRDLNHLMGERFSKGFMLEPERDERVRTELEGRELLIDREGPEGA